MSKNETALPTDPSLFLQLRDALQSDTDAIARRERAAHVKTLADHDLMRARMPRHRLIAVTDFTIHDDENPEGRVVRMGEEFEVSEFDLQRFLGKGLPPAELGARR